MKTKLFFLNSILVMLQIFPSGCKKFVSIDPPNDQVASVNVYVNDEAATAATRGIYATMMTDLGFASGSTGSITLLSGRSADEFVNYIDNDTYKQFYSNNILSNNSTLQTNLWKAGYRYIYATNAVLENMERSKNISSGVRNQLIGEAKFLRAFCYFYLTNLFGPVPVVLTTDYRVNSVASNSSQLTVYGQIIADLLDAKDSLSEDYPVKGERTRANKWGALSLLARVYLYTQQWDKAESTASTVIQQSTRYKLCTDLNAVFLKNSEETILQFVVPSISNVNTYEGNVFILTQFPSATTQVVLDKRLVNSFLADDQRRYKWIGSISNKSETWYYPYKYKVQIGNTPLKEYSMTLRLGEQYLIRSEARIQQNKIELGVADLNTIRNRAKIAMPIPFDLSKENALLAVEEERKLELFSEWGHRWFDLKRTNRADVVLRSIKAPNWQTTDQLYPIPASELINAVNLVQNPGY